MLTKSLSPAQYRRKVQSLKLSEREVSRGIVDFLKAERWYVIRLNSGLISTPDGRRMKVGQAGLPDHIAVRGDRYLFIETKATGGKLRPSQVEWHAWAASAGIPVITADGLGVFIQAYREMGY